MIKKKLLSAIIILFCFSLTINAQISTNERPISMKNNLAKTSIIELETPNMQKIFEEDRLFEGSTRFACPVFVNFDLTNSGHWTTLEDGSRLWRLSVILPNALSTHTIYNKFWLPDGAKFFVYNENTESFVGAITSEFIGGTKENPIRFSTAILLGEHITFEYYQPATVRENTVCFDRNYYITLL